MGVICGILGKKDPKVVRAMARAMEHRAAVTPVQSGKDYAVAASSETVARTPCLIDGRPTHKGATLGPRQLRKYCISVARPTSLALRGHFAAALRAKEPGHWYLLRDRLGVKPLYYFRGDGFLLFASELKGLLASGLVARRLNLDSVDRFLTLRCVPGPETIIQDVHRVPPGHVLKYAAGRIHISTFASFSFNYGRITREDAAASIEKILGDTMQRENPDALLWSGGIDSASLSTFAPHSRLIHVRIHRTWQNERRLANDSAKRLGHKMEDWKGNPLTDTAARKAFHALDEPFADASVLPIWLILEQAKRVNGVIATGHGADELLGGYPRYHFIHRAQDSAQNLVPVNLLSAVLPSLPPNAFIQRGSSFLKNIHNNLDAYLAVLSVFNASERESLYTETMKTVIHQRGGSAELLREHFEHADLSQSQLSLDLNIMLPDIMLAQCDRIAAAHGIDLRFPYLSDEMVDLLTTIPPEIKFGVRSKPLLRLAMKKRLPGLIRMRARRGFRIPQEGRVMAVVEQLAEQTLTQDRIEGSGLFRWKEVERIMQSHGHNIYRRRQFWALLMFFGWYREVMEA